MLIEQNFNYALGNFIMLTPGIKRLSEKINNKIDVYFTIPYVKECFMDCEFINHVDLLYEKPSFSSKMVNREIPDYKFMFNKMNGEDWSEKYHTYVDIVKEIPKHEEKYLLLLNGLGGLSLNDNDPKPKWYGKKEMTEEIFYNIKKFSKLPIYFTGSESDIKQNPWVKKICDKIEIGDIRKSLSLVRDAEKIISNDTGLSHCAGAMNKDILILWKDTPFVKNQNPGKNTKYSKKYEWNKHIENYLL
jgi:ADP-heptose:LPS heptosyltransferase